MKAWSLTAILAIAAIAVACGGDTDKQPTQQENPGGGQQGITLDTESRWQGLNVLRDAGADSLGLIGASQTASALPGITVLGYAEAKAAPDSVRIRVTVGSGMESFGPGSPQLELIEEEDLEPVVKALKDAGVSSDDISLNTFAPSTYGPFGTGAAQITFRWSRPEDVASIVQTAQGAVRRDTQYALQNVEVAFSRQECQPLEEEAQRSALSDARRRAERLAEMAGVSVGDITAISEVTAPFSYAPSSGCAALEYAPSLGYSSPYPASNSPSEVTSPRRSKSPSPFVDPVVRFGDVGRLMSPGPPGRRAVVKSFETPLFCELVEWNRIICALRVKRL